MFNGRALSQIVRRTRLKVRAKLSIAVSHMELKAPTFARPSCSFQANGGKRKTSSRSYQASKYQATTANFRRPQAPQGCSGETVEDHYQSVSKCATMASTFQTFFLVDFSCHQCYDYVHCISAPCCQRAGVPIQSRSMMLLVVQFVRKTKNNVSEGARTLSQSQSYMTRLRIVIDCRLLRHYTFHIRL